MVFINRVMNLLDILIIIYFGDKFLFVEFIKGELELENVIFFY